MSDENNKPSADDQNKAPVPLVEVLIGAAMKYTTDNAMTLAEMVGHFHIASRQVYDRAIASYQQQLQASAPPAEPVGDVGTEGTEGASQDAV